MTFKNLILEKHDFGIQILKISRPKALNALNSETISELNQALEAISTDETVRALILTGDGEKAFIAGADIIEMKDKSGSEGTLMAQSGQSVTKHLQLMPKPTIAAVNGFALGGGTEMAISCDFILASENAVFGQPEVCLGIMPGFGATVRLAHFVGLPRAKELIFSGRKVKAQEAKEMGLANHVYPLSELMNEALKLAEMMSKNSFSAVKESKILLNDFSEATGLEYKLDVEAQEFGKLFGSPDQREGMSAFAEKREPKFQGL